MKLYFIIFFLAIFPIFFLPIFAQQTSDVLIFTQVTLRDSQGSLVTSFEGLDLTTEDIQAIRNTALVENKDYIIDAEIDEQGNEVLSLRIGKDTSFNLTNEEETIYTSENYNKWISTHKGELTALRDSLFEDEFKKLQYKLSEARYVIPEELRNLVAGKYPMFNTTNDKIESPIDEWNPFFKGYFYAYEIANAYSTYRQLGFYKDVKVTKIDTSNHFSKLVDKYPLLFGRTHGSNAENHMKNYVDSLKSSL